MTIKFFITGTDTNVGKTYISVGLLNKFKSFNYSTIGIKPIASGCDRVGGNLFNSDALALQKSATIQLPYNRANPFALEAEIAPHIAAQKENIQLKKHTIIKEINKVFVYPADVYLIEGVGGWFVPINNNELVSDIVEALNIPVILIIAIKIGCLNHALLTTLAIKKSKRPLIGWIANCIQPNTKAVVENINTLKSWLEFPCLGTIPFKAKPENHIDIQPIINYFT